jgi:hypothetical protein
MGRIGLRSVRRGPEGALKVRREVGAVGREDGWQGTWGVAAPLTGAFGLGGAKTWALGVHTEPPRQ